MKDRIFFVSDTHFKYHGASAEERKKRTFFLDFLDLIQGARRLYLVGDIFDFWFEYRNVIPKHYGDILFGLHRTRESGTDVFITGGNHDYWFGSYMSDVLGITILPNLTTHQLQGRTVTLTHGDTLCPGDYAYKTLKMITRSSPVITMFRLIHPDILYRFARWFSQSSQETNRRKTERFAAAVCERADRNFFNRDNDVFIMGHIHYPILKRYGNKVFVILGDWETHYSYLKLEDGDVSLEYYNPDEKTLIEKR